MSTVDAFREGLDAGTLATVDALRAAIAGANPGLTERLKWNAPSFALGSGDDHDRITLGLERKGGVRVVLHRGAKVKDASRFAFDGDPSGLAKWLAPDRGVLVFVDRAGVEAKASELGELCARWVAATSP